MKPRSIHQQKGQEKGQMTIEMVLIMTFLLSATIAGTKLMRDHEVLATLVEGPWAHIRGMIEDGVWVPSGKSKAFNPSIKSRHRSFEGDDIPPT
jgi:hypothetical protein